MPQGLSVHWEALLFSSNRHCQLLWSDPATFHDVLHGLAADIASRAFLALACQRFLRPCLSREIDLVILQPSTCTGVHQHPYFRLRILVEIGKENLQNALCLKISPCDFGDVNLSLEFPDPVGRHKVGLENIGQVKVIAVTEEAYGRVRDNERTSMLNIARTTVKTPFIHDALRNEPGFPKLIEQPRRAKSFARQIEHCGAKLLIPEAIHIRNVGIRITGGLRKLFKNPCSQAELNKIVPFGFSLQRQKMVFFFAIKIV